MYKRNDVNQITYKTIININQIEEFVGYVGFISEIRSKKAQKVICNVEIASVRRYVFLVQAVKF
jgi:hypothetical protein